MDWNKTVGIIGVFSMLVSSGTFIYMSQDEKQFTYVCNSTEQVGIFRAGLSKTNMTGYPNIRGVEGVICKDGTWVFIADYKPKQVGSYDCDSIRCVPK